MEMLSIQRTMDQYVSLVASVSFSQMLSITGFLNLQKDVRLLTMFRLAFLRIIEQLIIFSLLNKLFLRMSQIQVGEKFVAVLLISKKASDTVWHEGLFQKLLEVNIKGNFLKQIQSLYKKSTCAIKINNCRTDFFGCKKV